MRFQMIHAKVKYKTIYRCSICAVNGTGDTVIAELDAITADQLAAELQDQPQTASHMPIGWGNYLSGFRCPACRKGNPDSAG